MKKIYVKQMSIFDKYTPEEALADEKGLTMLENEIKRYVYLNFRGKKNGIPMKKLAERFNLTAREVREAMANIN